jgi:hypothetical protein
MVCVNNYQQIRHRFAKCLLGIIRKFHLYRAYTLVQSQSLSYPLPANRSATEFSCSDISSARKYEEKKKISIKITYVFRLAAHHQCNRTTSHFL